MSAPDIAAEGVTNPSIDDLLTKTDSKYKLVLYSAKRARQINAYYSQLGEGLLEYVGPLVDTHVQEKPLSIALREINDDLLTCEDIDPAELAAEEQARQAAAVDGDFGGKLTAGHMTTDVTAGTPRRGPGRTSSSASPAASPPTRPASCCAASPSPATTSPSCRPRRRCGSSAPPPGPRCRASRSRPRCGTTSTRCRTCGSASPPTSSWSRPATADLLAKAAHGLADDLLTNTLLTARCPVVFAPAMHTEMWEHPATPANVATLRERGAVVIEPAEGRLTGADTGKGRLPEPAEIFEVCREVLARGAARARPGRPLASWSPPAAPASTSTRSASSATAPRACRATPWPAPPPPAAPR